MILGLVALAVGAALGEWWRLGDRPMTLVGSLQNGLTGDASLLLLKAALDGISAVALAATFGFGVLRDRGTPPPSTFPSERAAPPADRAVP